MYAVLVLAAILLSVAPMHARTLLAALPASAPGHQLACDGQEEAGEAQPTRPKATTSGRQAIHLSLTAEPALVLPNLPRPATASLLPPAAQGLLEHAPNAP
jgi:hypothetical protein